jgi:carbonic anhydrase/acetyltransferase-like protein (isoleucine patch superfamily)
MLIEYNGAAPRVAATAFVAPTAILIGDVTVGEQASIWFGAVLRADFGPIRVAARTSVQDNCIVHPGPDGTHLAEDVTIGHGAVLESCKVEAGAVIGMNAVVLDGAVIGTQAVIAAGSVVANGAQIPPRMLAAGAPAQIKKEVSGGSRQWIDMAANLYVGLCRSYREQGIDKLNP